MTRRNRKAKPMPQQSRADVLVPAVQRVAIVGHAGNTIREAIAEQAEWDDPDDPNTSGQKQARQISGYRRADPLLILHSRGGDVTKDHIRAAHRFRDDFEIGHGARPGYERTEIAGNGGLGAAEMQFAAMDSYKAAMRAVGIRLSLILVVVVLRGRSPTTYAEEKGVSAVKTMGYLIAALDRLQDHYEQGRPVIRPKKLVDATA